MHGLKYRNSDDSEGDFEPEKRRKVKSNLKIVKKQSDLESFSEYGEEGESE